MNSKLGLLNWVEVKSALVLAFITALVAIIVKVISAGSVFGLDWKVLVNTGTLAFLAFFVSTLKDLLTTSKGVIAGVQVK